MKTGMITGEIQRKEPAGMPTWEEQAALVPPHLREAAEAGELFVAGVDEAGRGCLAGPVVAAAVILPWEGEVEGLTDSKKVKAEDREWMGPLVKDRCIDWCVGVRWQNHIDDTDILQATLVAMRNAVTRLRTKAGLVLVDGNQLIPFAQESIPQRTVVKGDARVPAIAAASIIAKTFRDDLMVRFARQFPQYGFDSHMGYGTKAHLAAIAEHGPCRLHRMTFKGLRPEEKKQDQFGLPGM